MTTAAADTGQAALQPVAEQAATEPLPPPPEPASEAAPEATPATTSTAAGSETAGNASCSAPKLSISTADFDILRRVGEGSFSTVLLARYHGDGLLYAIKMISKSLVLRNKVTEYIRNERTILDRMHHPGIARLKFTFQDDHSLYMGLEYCPGGELYEQLQARGPLPLEDVRQYVAEVVDILAYLRQVEVIHRDLKPENLLLDGEGHLKLIDFGSAKALFLPPTERKNNNRSTSFVGTAEYVSPEVLNNTPISYASDLWALGCILYQLLAGQPPFKGGSEYLTFQLVTARTLEFPENFPEVARDLVERLLQLQASQRLGAASMAALQAHAFFEGIDWQKVRQRPAPTPVQLPAPSPEDTALDWELTSLFAQQPVRYEYLPSGTAV